MDLLIMAKAPLPGRAKTRLASRYGTAGAAALAAAALADTFAAARASRADRVVVCFDGDPTGVVPVEFDVVPQVAGDLATRLAAAWSVPSGPTVQIGMDTPQLRGDHLDAAFDALDRPGTDAVFGPAADGGWWALGLRRPADVFGGIATSRSDTGARQLARLHDLGLATTVLPSVLDVDEPADAEAVAAAAPWTRFAASVRELSPR